MKSGQNIFTSFKILFYLCKTIQWFLLFSVNEKNQERWGDGGSGTAFSYSVMVFNLLVIWGYKDFEALC